MDIQEFMRNFSSMVEAAEAQKARKEVYTADVDGPHIREIYDIQLHQFRGRWTLMILPGEPVGLKEKQRADQ